MTRAQLEDEARALLTEQVLRDGYDRCEADYNPDAQPLEECLHAFLSPLKETILTAIAPLLDRLDAAERVQAWQPMETAPQDGTMILLFPSSEWTEDTDGDYEVTYWDADLGGWYQHQHPDDYDGPTHWMPLPAPPKDQETA
jgi:hypothetical protein